MPRNGSGTYTRTNGVNSGSTTWQLDRDAGTKILASRHDTHDQDIADALTASIAKDGQTTPTANLPMGGFNHTGVSDATARTHYAAFGQMQDNESHWLGTTAGSSNAFTATLSPAITAYVTGMRFSFLADRANTGASTLNINGVGATAIVRSDGSTALSSGDIVSGDVHEVIYDGTSWVLLKAITISGNAATATALATARAIGIGGTTGLTATGVNFDGTAAINPALTGTLVIGNGGTGQTTASAAFGALKQDATTSATGVVELATAAEVKTGTDAGRVAPVSAMGAHLGMAKAWISASVSGGILTTNASYNCSMVRNTTGDFTLTITSALADNFPAISAIVQRASTDDNIIIAVKTGGTVNSNTIPLRVVGGGSDTALDPSFISVIVFGN